MWLHKFWVRNGIALAGLLLAIYLPDYYAIRERSGWTRWTPYLYLLLLYGWIVFHNRILFERLFERGKRRAYAGWLLLLLVIGTLNMTLTLRFGFGIDWPVPFLVKFYVFTVTGLGVYVIYRQLTGHAVTTSPPAKETLPAPAPLHFIITTDSGKRALATDTILYVESLENYVRVVTLTATFITRLTMKQAAEQLTDASFLRISRSHLVNRRHVTRYQNDELTVDNQAFRVGRTYKQYVAGQLKSTTNAVY